MTIDYSAPPDEFVSSIPVASLLPQRRPFVMIDSLVHFDMKTCISVMKVTEQNIFVEGGRLLATGLMENIAQTCAARIGYINKYINKKGIQIGLIGSIRHFAISKLPEVGDVIDTEVVVGEELFGMILATATVRCRGELCASTEIKIAVTDEEVEHDGTAN